MVGEAEIGDSVGGRIRELSAGRRRRGGGRHAGDGGDGGDVLGLGF